MDWFSSDLHLGHGGVIDFCNRPYVDREAMDRDLISRWNNTVGEKDLVYCLGDMSFWNPRTGVPLLRSLKGVKILVLGNHDKYSWSQYSDAGFVHICFEALIQLAGRRVRLSHYPYWPLDDSEPKHESRCAHSRPKREQGEFLLCGHVHNLWKVKDRQINVGCDQWGYSPVSSRVIEGLIARIEKEEALGAGILV